MILDRLGVTLELSSAALLVALLAAIPLGTGDGDDNFISRPDFCCATHV